MGFFERFSPKNKSIRPEGPATKKAIQNQENIGIRGDVSAENYIPELNKNVETRELNDKDSGPVSAGQPWEDMAQQEQIVERFHALNEKYNEIAQEIKKRTNDKQELSLTYEGAVRASHNLNMKSLDRKGGKDIDVQEQMRNAEDRVERLKRKLDQRDVEIMPLYHELGDVEAEIEILAGLMNDELPGEETVGGKRYDFTQN